MDIVIKSAVAVILAYLLGSISWALIVGRLARGIDMTEVGDGRIGAAFSIRKLGFGWGLTVGVLDFVKGAVAVGIPMVLGLPIIPILLCGLAVVAGHNWSVFFGFRGGRGAASTFGLLVILALPALLMGCLIVALPFYFTRGIMYIRGMLRTTLMFAVIMALTSIFVLIDAASGFLPDVPWMQEPSVWVAALPLALLALNVAKRS